ncbi:MAG: hypothetical protein IVW53_13870 [Chloroflexi bacterium]|nr:hypothetical protein [Chloroflexota bacterium]
MAAPGLIPTIVGNLVPLIGVLLFGWDLPSIVVMYWIETGVGGLVNVLRIRKSMALGPPTVNADGSIERPIVRAALSGSWRLPLIWLVAYGIFWAILGPFVIQIANGGFYEGASQTGWSGVSADVIAWGTVSLVGGQVGTYTLDYVIGRRYLTVTPLELLRDPFVRIFIILATIAVGGVGIALLGSPVGFLAAMVVAKTIVEFWFTRPARAAISTGSCPTP